MIIYKITNTINEKVYIGQTIQKLDRRWKDHYKKSSKCSAISSAIQKYGKENFTIEEIDGANSLSELNYLEKHYIYKYKSLAPNGYNLETGGNNKKLSKSTKEKLSKINKNTIPPNRKGCKISEEHKSKISQTMRGVKKSKQQIEKFKKTLQKTGTSDKKVKCLNNNIVYKSMSEAARQLNLSVLGISRNARGLTKSYKGFVFIMGDK